MHALKLLKKLDFGQNSLILVRRKSVKSQKPPKEAYDYQSNLNTPYDWSLEWLDKFANRTLSESEREGLIKYLWPSGLFAKDARPHLYKGKQFKPSTTTYIKNGVPLFPAYYMAAPKFQDHLYKVLLIHSRPIDKNYAQTKKPFVFVKDEFLKKLNEKVPKRFMKSFRSLIKAVHRREDSSKYEEFLAFYHTENPLEETKEVRVTDYPIYTAIGRRKTSFADVELKHGTGIIEINNRSLEDFFYNEMCRESVLAPFHEIHNFKFDVSAQVIGGGHTGQAAAIKMGISLCLSAISSEYQSVLNKVGFSKQDNRIIERKKYARHKARKRYTWVAR